MSPISLKTISYLKKKHKVSATCDKCIIIITLFIVKTKYVPIIETILNHSDRNKR